MDPEKHTFRRVHGDATESAYWRHQSAELIATPLVVFVNEVRLELLGETTPVEVFPGAC